MTSPPKIILTLMVLAAVIMPGAAAVETNSTVIDPGDQAYVQFEFWVFLFSASLVFLILSFVLPRCTDICAVLATLFSSVAAYITLSLEFFEIIAVGDTAVLVHYTCHHSWLALTVGAVFIVCMLNTFRVAFDVYWNKNLREV